MSEYEVVSEHPFIVKVNEEKIKQRNESMINKSGLCRIGIHDWEILAHGGQIASTIWKKCRKCNLAIKESSLYGRTNVDEIETENKLFDSLEDITQIEICPSCLSRNIEYHPQFTMNYSDGTPRAAGSRKCLDCGHDGDVM